MTDTSMATTRIPSGLIADVIDCINDRCENLEDLAADDSFPNDLREENRRLANDLRAVAQELDDPGTIIWKHQEAGMPGELKQFVYTGPDIKPRAGGIADTIHTGHVVRLTRDQAQAWARSHSTTLIICHLAPDAPVGVLLPARHLRPDHPEEGNHE